MIHHNRLLIAIIIGEVAGILCGGIFGHAMEAIGWIGHLFLDTLKMVIIPLIAAAVITGITSLGDIRKLGRLGGYTILYYSCTTAIAVLIGLILVNIIQPGVGITELSQKIPDKVASIEPTGISDIIKSFVSPNIVGAASDNSMTESRTVYLWEA